jgi:hypothetical protein
MLRNILSVILLAVIFNSVLQAQPFQKNNTYLINSKKNKTLSPYNIESFQNTGQISRNVYFGVKHKKPAFESRPEIFSTYKERINTPFLNKTLYKLDRKSQHSNSSEFLYQKRHLAY